MRCEHVSGRVSSARGSGIGPGRGPGRSARERPRCPRIALQRCHSAVVWSSPLCISSREPTATPRRSCAAAVYPSDRAPLGLNAGGYPARRHRPPHAPERRWREAGHVGRCTAPMTGPDRGQAGCLSAAVAPLGYGRKRHRPSMTISTSPPMIRSRSVQVSTALCSCGKPASTCAAAAQYGSRAGRVRVGISRLVCTGYYRCVPSDGDGCSETGTLLAPPR